MKSRLRKFAYTLLQKFARRGLVGAAENETSYETAMRRALARKPFLKTKGRYLSREEAHDRGRSHCATSTSTP